MTAPGARSSTAERRGPSRWLLVRSRWIDRIAALLVAPFLAPLAAAIALVVRRRDGAPCTIRLARAGHLGAPFLMWKFRTMRAAAADGSAGGAVITSVADDRVTALGRTLRRWRLDELPQIVNVVSGDMALLGPRPETPSLVDLADPAWSAVLDVRPGITGPTQLVVEAWEADSLVGEGHEARYRDEILPVKLAVDRWYVEHSSPSLDLGVCWSMVERFVLGRADTWVQRRARVEVPETQRIPGP